MHNHMPRLLPSLALASILGSVTISSSSAQSPDSIPRDLVLGLVGAGNFPGRDPLRVGTIPNYVPVDVIPPGALIMGSLSLPGRTAIVLQFPPTVSDPDVVAREYLASTGWTSPEPFTPNYRPRGFVTSTPSSFSSQALCRKGEHIMLLPGRQGGIGPTMTVHWMPEGGPGLCKPPLVGRGSRSDDSPVPALLPPEGMGQETGGGSMSSNGSTYSARLTGTMTPDSVRQHYADQLLAAGWTAGPAMGTAVASLQTFRHEGVDDAPGPWHALLTAAVLGRETTLDVLLQVRRP